MSTSSTVDAALAHSVVPVVGVVDGGDVTDTYSNNSVRLVLTEIQSATPGLVHDFYFENVTPGRYYVKMNGYYAGNAAHNVKVQMYDFVGAGWVDLTADADDIPSGAADVDYSFYMPSTFGRFFEYDQCRVRFNHPIVGIGTHRLYIDYLRLDTSP